MVRKNLKLALVASAATLVIVAPGVSLAGAGTVSVVTLCINPHNGVVHFPSSGKCGPGQNTVVVGKGVVGIRGVGGVAGPAGPAGGTGPAGPAGGPQGLQGIQGLRGLQGLPGQTGAQGTDGPQGLAGPQGVIGPIGPAGPAGVAGAAGPAGPAGGVGPAGVNAFHLVTATNSTIGTTITASCAGGQVASGGGYTAPAGVVVTAIGPHVGDTGWDLSFQNNTGLTAVTVTADCVTGTAS